MPRPSLLTAFCRLLKVAAISLLFLASIAGLQGQSALDGFDPNANGTVRVVIVQPDGKILLGGDFTTLSPNGGPAVARNRLARLNPDGTLDNSFDPNANAVVQSIALQADGQVLVGGNFTNIGGQTRNRIARLDATTGLADAFDPNANGTVFALAAQTDGKILAGGFFSAIGGQTRNRIARLDPTTGLADSFDPNPTGTGTVIYSIAVQADGKILAGGFFSSIAGEARRNLARLDQMTGAADSFDPQTSDEVRCVAVQADGKVLAGGFFTLVAGQSRNSIVRLDATTGLPDPFNPNANNGVFALAVQTDGKILVGGDFFGIGGQQRHQIARLDPITGLADSFNPNGNNSVNSIAVQPDGKILAGGGFTTLSPNGGAAVTRNRIARLETDGRLDQTMGDPAFTQFTSAGVYPIAIQPDGKTLIGGPLSRPAVPNIDNLFRLNSDCTFDDAFNVNPDPSARAAALAVQADGKILVGGAFTSIGGQMRNYIARLDPITGLADSFDPHADWDVSAIAVQVDGKILVAGWFTSIGGQTRNHIARIDPVSGVVDSFDPNADGNVRAIAVQADGKIVVGGIFTHIGGEARNRIARLDAATGLADSFDPNANGDVNALVGQPDGKILVGGAFTDIGGQSRNRIARLDPTTGVADSFNPNANFNVVSIAPQANGKILVGGGFNRIGGQMRNALARVDGVTGLADTFNPNPGSSIFSLALRADGKVLVGGGFSSIGGQTRQRFARLSNDTAAWQDLFVAQNGIFWSRGGSSPMLTRTSFESSPDNVNYTSLGDGVPSGNNWFLFGLSLPAGQNLYIRARGYFRGGNGGGSESIVESVKYGPAGPPAPTPTPTPTPTPPPACLPNPIVMINADSGLGSLRQAIADACPGSTITFDMSLLVSPITLTSEALGLTKSLTISGPGAAQLTVTTTAPGSIFQATAASPAVVTVSGLTVTGAQDSQFGGIANMGSGTLNIVACVVSHNRANGGGAGISNQTGTTNIIDTTVDSNDTPGGGGGVLNGAGTVNIFNSTLISNTSFFSGGGGGGISNSNTGTVNVTNCTIMFNSASSSFGSNSGGGIRNGGSGTVTITNSTIVNNSAEFGGGISNENGGPVQLRNSIVALNAGFTMGRDLAGAFVTQGHNLIGRIDGGTGFTPGANGDLVGTNAAPVDPQLGPIVNNGGPTLTRALINTSPAIDAGDNTAITNPPFSGPPFYDQRGVGFPRIVNGTVDIGAFEAATPSPSPTPTATATASPTPTNPPVTPTATPGSTPSPTPASSPSPTPTPGTLGNISTRLRVLSGDNAMIGGMIATGTASKRVIIRAIGPSLTGFGVPGALANPTLDLFQGTTLLFSNDDWSNSTQQAEIAASGLAPSNNLESAVIWTLTPGQNYTAVVRGINGTTGIGVVEAFDLDQAAASKLGNISTRGFVDVDDNVMIAGLIVSPGNGTSTKVLVRALGPTLGDFGVQGFLANPTVDLVNASGAVIRSNNNWQDDAQQRALIEAAGLAPNHDEEAALVETVPPGAYTAIVRGNNRTTGVGLVEAYNIP